MPAFQFSLDKRLRTLGLEGALGWAQVHEGTLLLQDNANHWVRISPDEIARLRIGYFDARRRGYHMRLWRDALDKPLMITPTLQTWSAYRQTVNELAILIVEHDRIDRIETGTTKFDALLGPILMVIPTLGALLVSLFVLTNEPWWGRLIPPIVPLIILALLAWVSRNRYWPQRIRDLGDLKVQLPPG